MSKKSAERNVKARELGNMHAFHKPACVIRGGKSISIEDPAALRAEFAKGMPVMPPVMVMLDDPPTDELPAAAVEFEKQMRDGRLPRFIASFFDWPSEDGLGNAHEVSEALMLDIILARQSDGWRWIMGDVRNSHGHMSHSWLEYKGWAIDASGGRVLIWPAWYYRATFDARKLTERDAVRVRAFWRKRGGKLDQYVETALAPRLVRVLDHSNDKLTEMLVTDLPPGMIQAQIEGIEGPVWVDETHLSFGAQYVHHAFPDAIRTEIKRIAGILKDVAPLSILAWEENFRRFQNAEERVSMFACLAEAYTRMTAGADLTSAQKLEYFRALVSGLNCDRDAFLRTFRVEAITRYEAIAARNVLGQLLHERGVTKSTPGAGATAEPTMPARRNKGPGAAA